MPLPLSHKFILLFIFSIIFYNNLYAQYPFEKRPAINYKKFDKWKIKKHTESGDKIDYTICILDFFPNHEPLTVKFEGDHEKDSTLVRVFRSYNLIKTFFEPIGISEYGAHPQSAFSEDINGDGLKDLKIMIPNNGCCGAYNYYARMIYLFQFKNRELTKISFTDWVMDYVEISPGEIGPDYANRPERDFDGDHNFEIITQTFQNYGKHNYMLYNLYNFDGNKLINVNRKANYPIMIQLLDGINYKVTNKVTNTAMKRLTRALPDDYDQK